jgi:O-antigen ligase
MDDIPVAAWRLWPIRLASVLALVLVPVWYRLPGQPALFAPFYVTRFALFIPLIIVCFLFAVLGFPGIRRFAADRTRAAWAFCLLALAVWMYASAGWAVMRDAVLPDGSTGMSLALNAAVQFAVVALFAIATSCVRVPATWVVGALVFGLFWNGILGGQQAALQQAAGGLWASLGEFPIAVGQPRISVVQADGVRLLRPYGLLPHPNMLAGFFVASLMAGAAWATNPDSRRWLPGGAAVVVGLWGFMLTFSRGAFLALFVAGLLLLYLFLRSHRWNRQLGILLVVAAILGLAFAVSYYPFLLARAGQGSETTEQYSVAERTELNSAAYAAIQGAPLVGVGAGNLPWRSAAILQERGSIVAGNYPHNVWLTTWGEIGLVGVALLAASVSFAVVAAWPMVVHGFVDSPARAALLAGFVGLLVAGWFEYYPVTLLQFQTVWWALAAAALAPAEPRVIES